MPAACKGGTLKAREIGLFRHDQAALTFNQSQYCLPRYPCTYASDQPGSEHVFNNMAAAYQSQPGVHVRILLAIRQRPALLPISIHHVI